MSDTIVLQTSGDTISVNIPSGAVGISDGGQRGVGVPSGGSTGQILAKATGDDYDTEWITNSGGGGGSSTFIGLTDTPGSFVGDRLVTVNTAGNALEFPTASDARTLLGLGTAALAASGDFATASHTHTLSDVTDAGTAAASDTGDFDAAGTAAAAVASHAGTTTGVHGISAFGATLVDDVNAAAARTTLGLGSAALSEAADFATAAQGALADSAIQSADLATVATTGAYSDLVGIPSTFAPSAHTHTASEVTDFDTAVDTRIGAASLADLGDVGALVGLDTFDVLAWDGADWGNSDIRVFIASYLTGTAEITDISDVTVSTPSAGEVLRYNGGGVWVNAALGYSDLSGVPSEFTPESHTHTASEVTDFSTAADARIAAASLDDLTDVSVAGPSVDAVVKWDGLGSWIDAQLAAGDIKSGTFATARIPSLPASQITSGTFATARIPSLDASKITTGTFGTARIPNLDTSKITSGTFADARIQSSNVTQHEGDLSILGSQISGKQGPGAAFDGQGSALTSGVVVRSPVTESGTVSTIYADADQSGSVSVICRWYDSTDTTFASPTSLGTLTISSAQKGSLGSLSQAVDPGDTLEFEISGAATNIQRLAVRSRI